MTTLNPSPRILIQKNPDFRRTLCTSPFRTVLKRRIETLSDDIHGQHLLALPPSLKHLLCFTLECHSGAGLFLFRLGRSKLLCTPFLFPDDRLILKEIRKFEDTFGGTRNNELITAVLNFDHKLSQC